MVMMFAKRSEGSPSAEQNSLMCLSYSTSIRVTNLHHPRSDALLCFSIRENICNRSGRAALKILTVSQQTCMLLNHLSDCINNLDVYQHSIQLCLLLDAIICRNNARDPSVPC